MEEREVRVKNRKGRERKTVKKEEKERDKGCGRRRKKEMKILI